MKVSEVVFASCLAASLGVTALHLAGSLDPRATATPPASNHPASIDSDSTDPTWAAGAGDGAVVPSLPIASGDPLIGSAPITTSLNMAPTTDATTETAERGAAALAGLAYPWRDRLPGWTVEFHPGRDGVLGLTFVDERRIEIYVRTDQSPALLAHVLAHELGHAVDVSLNTGDDRRRWQTARGIESSPWWPGDGATDFSTGAGDFAEAFAAWQAPGEFRSRIGGELTAGQLALLAELAGG